MKTTLLFLSVFLTTSLFGQNVYIPDANFKAYLVGNSQINTNGDTEIQVSEASSFDGAIWCSSLSISDLTGIEAFTALTYLECSFNELTSIDVSSNTALTYLHGSYNQLTNLDVSQNTALETLWISHQGLTSLDVSSNTALKRLHLHTTLLTSLDVSNNTSLDTLICKFNNLTYLDISNNPTLIKLDVAYNQIDCLNLANGNNTNLIITINNQFWMQGGSTNYTCIEVDDVNYSTTNWFPNYPYSEDCGNDCTSSLNELTTSKNLIQILDMMGRETSFKPNTPLIYVYDDGSIEKVFTIE